MKKRIFGAILAVVLILVQAVSVFAAPSRTTDIQPAGDSIGYYETKPGTEETFAYLDAIAPEVKQLILDINKGTLDLDAIIKAAPELKAELENKTLVTGFFDLIPINGGVKTEDGKYIVTISVPSLTKAMKNVRLLHYSTERNIWEVIVPNEVDYDNKEITAEFIDLSPVAVIADMDETNAGGSGTSSKPAGTGTSPKTGTDTQWPIFGVSAVALFGIAVLMFAKNKKNA